MLLVYTTLRVFPVLALLEEVESSLSQLSLLSSTGHVCTELLTLWSRKICSH
jgi:hypothetical protein